MAKRYEIELKFSSPGAKKLRQALDALAAAQGRLAKKQSSLNIQSKMAQKNTVKLIQSQEKHRLALFKSQKQIGKLNLQLQKMRLENKALKARIDKTSAGLGRMRLATAGLTRSVGVIRNQILLFTFAFGGLIAGFRSAIETSMQFEAVKVRLNSMFGSVRAGEQAFRKFNQVAATTPFTLTDVVEAGAALKAFGTNAEEMIKPTADLAAFMGVTATEAAQALGRAFAGGAGAADILRERGILQLIRDTKGIEDLSKMTLPEFRKALEETLLDPSVGIAGATDRLSKTLTGMVSNMADAFTRMKAAIGDFIDMKGVIETLTGAFESLGERMRQASETPFETTIRHLQEMGVETSELELTQAKLLKTRMEEEGVVQNLSEAETELQRSMDLRLSATQGLAALQENLIKNGTSEEEIRERISQIDKEIINAGRGQDAQQIKQLQNERASLINIQDALDRQRQAVEFTEEQVKLGLMTVQQATEYQAQIAKILGLEEQIAESKKIQNEEDDKSIEKQKTLFNLIKENFNQIQQVSSLFMDQFGKVLSLQKQNLDRRIENEIKALKRTEEFQNASMERRQTMEDEIRAKFAKQQQQIFAMQKKMNIAKIIMDTAVQLNKLIGDGIAASLFDPTAPFRAKAITAGLLALSAKQIDLVSKQQAPAFARGGSFITGGEQFIKVGDNAGGRERVDITPLSSPDFGDAGGGGSINVNIMGNVIGTQEFVRDNLLPEIEDSIRRNLA